MLAFLLWALNTQTLHPRSEKDPIKDPNRTKGSGSSGFDIVNLGVFIPKPLNSGFLEDQGVEGL